MKTLIFSAVLAATGSAALGDGYVLGSGRWTCAEAGRIAQAGSPIEQGQLVGWLLGFWTAATFERETKFVDIVENAGGRAIYDATLKECADAPPETLLYRVAQEMIRNTR